jgi:hypothetical protein
VQVQVPVLMIHGLERSARMAGAVAADWEWVDGAPTIVTVPGAGRWAEHAAPELVSSMEAWPSR